MRIMSKSKLKFILINKIWTSNFGECNFSICSNNTEKFYKLTKKNFVSSILKISEQKIYSKKSRHTKFAVDFDFKKIKRH